MQNNQADLAELDQPVLVTGASGHTGRRLVKALLERGAKVRILTRDPGGIKLHLRKSCEIARASLEDQESTREAMRGCAAVIAVTHIKFAPQVISAMQAEGVRRGIFMSSTRRFTRYPETTAAQVISGEAAVEESGLDWTIIRASMIYGGKQDNNMTNLLQALRQWPVFPLPAGGRMKWQPVFTWDVVGALIEALRRPVSIGKAYTVAGPEEITYREMLKVLAQEAGLKRLFVPVPLKLVKPAVALYEGRAKKPRITMDMIRRLEEDKVFDISEARKDLGFDPVSFREGIRRKIAGQV